MVTIQKKTARLTEFENILLEACLNVKPGEVINVNMLSAKLNAKFSSASARIFIRRALKKIGMNDSGIRLKTYVNVAGLVTNVIINF